MKGFDIKRLWAVMKWDVTTNQKQIKAMTATCAAIYLIGIIAMMLMYHFMGRDYNTLEMFTHKLAEMFCFIFVIWFLGTGLIVFSNLKTRQQCLGMLMLPVSNAEKFMSRLLLSVVGSITLEIIALVAADLLHILLCMMVFPDMTGSVTLETLRVMAEMTTNLAPSYGITSIYITLAYTIVMCAAIHSIILLLSSLMYGRPQVLVFVWIVFFSIRPIEEGFPYFGIPLKMGLPCSADAAVLCVTALLLCLSVFCYAFSYRQFTRMQLIENKL